MSKRIFALILCFVLCISLLPAAAAEDIELVDDPEDTVMIVEPAPDAEIQAEVANGSCGDKVTWSLDLSGTLTLTGTGATWNFSDSDPSFLAYADDIQWIIVSSGVTKLGDWLFCNLKQVTYVSLPNTLTEIGTRAFCSCKSLEFIGIPGSVRVLGNLVFSDCTSLKEVDFRGHAPTTIADNCFEGLSLIADYYQVYSWTADKKQDFGAEKLTWVAKNQIGPNVTWYLYQDGMLKLDGTGATSNFGATMTGFNYFYDEIRTVVVGSGITALGTNLFEGLGGEGDPVHIDLPASMQKIGSLAFMCEGLLTIRATGSVPSFGDDVFEHCPAVLFSYPCNGTGWIEVTGSAHGADHMIWAGSYAQNKTGIELESYDSGSGKAGITVASMGDQAVLVAVQNGSSYTKLTCSTSSGVHRYSFGLNTQDDVDKIFLALRGDANRNGTLEMRDATLICQIKNDKYGDALSKLIADVNNNGIIEIRDATLLCQARNEKYTILW